MKGKKDYYRYLTKKYSPGVLRYIDDFIIDDDAKIATLMYLELKELIAIGDIIKITGKNPGDLDRSSTYVYTLVKENCL